ncbi:MAG TPA: hypothetical protein VMT99_03090 [Candidatus Paceibacterota bacterium]|nr:hypothetical protein [Candidatus Paceibacterota bacterium]
MADRTMHAYCPDCGPMPVSHAVERWNATVDDWSATIFAPLEAIWNLIRPAVAWLKPGRLAPPVFGALAALGFGTIADRPDRTTTDRSRVLWEEAERRGIAMREFRPFGLPRNIFFATKNGDTRVFDGLPRPRLAHEAGLDWMDDKGAIIRTFGRAGIPVPRGGDARTIRQAEAIFASIGGPVIVKPAIGSRSRHTYMHITTLDALRHAFKKAREISRRVVVEEELPGFVFRITLIGGRIGGIMRREPPHVIGDGRRSLRELIAAENENPLRKGPVFHAIEVDLAFVAAQGHSLDTVPAANAMVMLHPKVSRSFGASTTEVEDVHPDNRELFLAIGRIVDDPLIGIDFMIEDMARSWRSSRCGVIECNSLPFIDLHHFPLKGPARNVAGMVWDLVFP